MQKNCEMTLLIVRKHIETHLGASELLPYWLFCLSNALFNALETQNKAKTNPN